MAGAQMKVAWLRVDERLVHGQVVEGWLPRLALGRLLVIDAEAAADPFIGDAMGLALPPELPFEVRAPGALPELTPRDGLLVRDVATAHALVLAGLRPPRVQLGNTHHRPGRRELTPHVKLDEAELAQLAELEALGIPVVAQALPVDAPQALAVLRGRWGAAAS